MNGACADSLNKDHQILVCQSTQMAPGSLSHTEGGKEGEGGGEKER